LIGLAVEWKKAKPQGQVEIVNGELERISISNGVGSVNGRRFTFTSQGTCRLEIFLKQYTVNSGSGSTIICVRTAINPFSFFLRDISKEYPILIPRYGVVITEISDMHTYRQIEEAVLRRGLRTNLQQIEKEKEENFANAAAKTRKLTSPTWLGLSRDMRIFEVDFGSIGYQLYCVRPRFAGEYVQIQETNNSSVSYHFFIGRGIGCVENVSRRLEEGVLPILTGTVSDDGVIYEFKAFVTLEKRTLTPENLHGTHFLVADRYTVGHVFTAEQEHELQLALSEKTNEEETVLFIRIKARNIDLVPRYAWFKSAFPRSERPVKWTFDGTTGLGAYSSGRVFCISKMNEKPMAQEEIAVLLKPSQEVTFDLYIPHCPLSQERALKLASQKFEDRYVECRKFWKQKLKSCARIKLPEKRIEEMVQAGLLHLDLVAYGLEPDGTVAPTIGIYSPIGSESAPIIQFFDSMGWHELARRSIRYFLDKQHKDGFIQNFDEYMLETGAALWVIGEHYRYTHDIEFARHIAPKLLKSCKYIIKWRERNKKEELRDKGYGMIDGKVADPPDPYHQFMLNGYAYLGISRAAEVFSILDAKQSRRLLREAEEMKKDIRNALFEALAESPVVPLGDGTWCPTLPPWAETRGLVSLYIEKGQKFSHLTFFCRDSLLGPLHL